MADYAGACLAGTYTPMIRIDIAGHCLSALIDLQEIAARK